jgi:hypothetical protein
MVKCMTKQCIFVDVYSKKELVQTGVWVYSEAM